MSEIKEKSYELRPKPSRRGKRKLCPIQILSIRAEFSTGNTDYIELSRKYGVTCTMIRRIILKQSWRHI